MIEYSGKYNCADLHALIIMVMFLRCDAVRNQIGFLDQSGRDVPGGPPEDPSEPIYSSSLVRQFFCKYCPLTSNSLCSRVIRR